jgi:hypothetical protein
MQHGVRFADVAWGSARVRTTEYQTLSVTLQQQQQQRQDRQRQLQQKWQQWLAVSHYPLLLHAVLDRPYLLSNLYQLSCTGVHCLQSDQRCAQLYPRLCAVPAGRRKIVLPDASGRNFNLHPRRLLCVL